MTDDSPPKPALRRLVIVFGDQLDPDQAAFDGFDPAQDQVLMVEARHEATYLPQHKLRLAYFFSAMRHFHDRLRARGWPVTYCALDGPEGGAGFETILPAMVAALQPAELVALEPGDWRVRSLLLRRLPQIRLCPDRHFLCDHAAFSRFMAENPKPRLEYFYRGIRRKLGLLIETDGAPTGGRWNFDTENRVPLGPDAPPVPQALSFPADAISQAVVRMVNREFPDAPGRLEDFSLPVTAEAAQALLDDFVQNRLPHFGTYQDAMRSGDPFLFHSRLSGPLNLHLIDPRQVIAQVLANPAEAKLNAVEAYLRQVIGWREYARGIYWHTMPAYAARNGLGADLPMPRFYWTGETEAACLRDAIQHTIIHAYAHHIERLMVLGLFALLLGVRPYDVHRWHMSMFWDAIDWVSLPNTLGMGQHADGGLMGSKPYAASGNYINRMSDHCRQCRFDPKQALGPRACPFTTLYWDFLARHRQTLGKNHRLGMMFATLDRKDPAELRLIRNAADRLRASATAADFLP